MNDTVMTIVGNLVDEPRLRVTKNGHSVANFRVASTSRRYDSEAGKWVDNATLFVTVTCWQNLQKQRTRLCSLRAEGQESARTASRLARGRELAASDEDGRRCRCRVLRPNLGRI